MLLVYGAQALWCLAREQCIDTLLGAILHLDGCIGARELGG